MVLFVLLVVLLFTTVFCFLSARSLVSDVVTSCFLLTPLTGLFVELLLLTLFCCSLLFDFLLVSLADFNLSAALLLLLC